MKCIKKLSLYLFILVASIALTNMQALSQLRTVATARSMNRTKQQHPYHRPLNKNSKKRCKPCEGKKKALGKQLEDRFHKDVPEWTLNRSEPHTITRLYIFPDFKTAIQFIDRIAELAEQEGHHPNIELRSYNQVHIELYTHAISGLSSNDFILAEKIDDIWYLEFAGNNYIQ